MKSKAFKWILLTGLVAWSLALVTPLKEKIKLGLDLQGGTSFVLEVDTSELTEDQKKDAGARALEVLRNRVDAMGIAEPMLYLEPKSHRIVVQLPGLKAEDRDSAVRNIQSAAYLEFRMVHEHNDRLVNALFEKKLAPPGYRIVEIEETGPQGRSFTGTYYERVRKDQSFDPAKTAELRKAQGMWQAPPGHEFLLRKEVRNNRELYTPFFVNRRSELTGESLVTAGVNYQEFGQAVVSIKFDAKGAKRFARITADYAPGGPKNPSPQGQRLLAVVLDGTVFNAPWIKTPIYNGEAVIEGSFSSREANDLSVVLRAGSLPAPVTVVEERGVDPTLGRDSIASGKRAAILGAIAVVIFMFAYYLLAGAIANLALLLDILLLPLGMYMVSGFLGIFSGSTTAGLPVLTLPGIAGIVLTIGMAVDANVLIFERIREELAAGKSLGGAISAGYEKAFSTIFDANITTLLTAVILFWQGSGPIRGFAVTLSAGIVVSMFVVLVITRLLFQTIADHTRINTIRMLNLLKEPKFDFLGKRRLAAIISLAVIVITGGIFLTKGVVNFGVDFTGGTVLTFRFEEKVDTDQLRATLLAAGVRDPQLQYQRELTAAEGETPPELLLLKTAYGEGDAAREALTAAFSEQGFKDIQTDTVGPQIGSELKKQGLKALIFAMIGIVLYITIRFEFPFAVGAIVALLHDVLITVGIYCLCGRQLTLPIVAALLTIVGYSVNDTIVVFDRIREDIKLMKGKPYSEIANLSINQTLSRTILTSLTTLLSVVMLLLFGGGAINDFALALFIGIVVGTYSSVFIATPVALLWHPDRKKQ